MAVLNQAILTEQGIQLMNEAGTGTNTISFTKAVASSDNRYTQLSNDELETLTDLDNIQQTVKPSAPYPAFTFNDADGNQQYSDTPTQGSNKSKSATTIPMVFKNKGNDAQGNPYEIDKDYLIQAIGLYAHDGNRNQDILYLVITASTPHLMPAYDGNVSSFKVKEITAVGRVDKLNVVIGDFDMITEDELNAKLSGYVSSVTPQALTNDFNFNGKLQHNGKDVVDSSQLKDAIEGFSGDDKAHNFTDTLQYKGNDVATTNNVVIDNHDGTVNVNGQKLSVMAIYSNNTDANTLTTPGRVLLEAGLNHSNVPNSSNWDYVIDTINENNGNLFQKAMSSGYKATWYRYFNNNQWSPWYEFATTDYVNAKFGDAYNRAVDDAEKYTDENPGYILTKNESDAITLANNATKPTLYVYPDTEDINAISLAKHVNGIYGYGVGNLQPVSWNVTNDNPSNFKFNNVSITYNPNDKQFTLHGSITTINNGNANDNVLTLNISQLGLNEITSNSLNNQPVSVDTDTFRKNIIMSMTANYASGSTINVEGDTINLGYDATLKPKIDSRIFGVSWNQGQSSTLKRTDDAVGMQAGINGAQNDFDNVSVWKGMHRVTDSLGNVFVRIPKFYIKRTQNSSLSTWQLSLDQIDNSYVLPKCFWDFSNNKELPYVDVGAYLASTNNNTLQSITGVASTVNLTLISQFRQFARNTGAGYQQYDIHVLNMLQVLFIIEFATLDSQSITGSGDSNYQNNGTTDSVTASSGTAKNHFVYRGIEDIVDNNSEYVDGITFYNGQIWVCDDANNYIDRKLSYPYYQLGYTRPSDNNWIQSMGLDPEHPLIMFPQSITNTQGYYNDEVWTNNVAGVNDLTTLSNMSGAGGGLFGLYSNGTFDRTNLGRGARLVRKAITN